MEQGPLILAGIPLAVTGIDMGKYSPIPIVKAKRVLEKGIAAGQDPARYSTAIHKLNAAIALSTISILSNVAAEVLGAIALFRDWDEPEGKALAYGCMVTGGIGIATSVASSVMVSNARKALYMTPSGIGLNSGKNGLGIVYRLP
jgi:hypothetical protein